MSEYGKEMVIPDGCYKPFDLMELIQRVKEENIEVTVYFEPGRTEVSLQPHEPFRPMCPFAKEG
jgi:hypothetical protein